MPHYTLENILRNNKGIVDNYQEAVKLWNEIWKDPKSETVEGLADLLSSKQLTFEANCGGRYLGQEVMAWSGFAQLYDTISGFTAENKEKAIRLKEAFQASHCSLEVISIAEEAAKSYI